MKVVSEMEGSWSQFSSEAPSWASGAIDGDGSIDVVSPWLDAEFSSFPLRGSVIDPYNTITTLSPSLKGRFFRYLSDKFGMHYPEFISILHYIDTTTEGAKVTRMKVA